MIPRFKPELDWHELVAAFTPSKKDDAGNFEKEFAKKFGQKHAIAFSYGRTALLILLEAMGLRNNEIICPAYTCVVVPHAIVFSKNIPVFVDCKDGDFNMDLDIAEDAITERTGAIVATSIFGYPVDLDKLDQIRAKYPKIRIIQDCAHSFAAEWKGRPVHKAGDAAIFGLNISKLITSIFGGMITTDDDVLAKRLRILRNERLKRTGFLKNMRRLLYLLSVYPAFWEPIYGFVNFLENAGVLNRFVKYYDESCINMPTDYLENLTRIEARVGLQQLKKYDYIIQEHRRSFKYWKSKLAGRKDIVIPQEIKGATYSHFVCLVENRDAWIKEWQKHKMQLGKLIEYSIPYMKAYEYLRKKDFPVSRRYACMSINFPLVKGVVRSAGCQI